MESNARMRASELLRHRVPPIAARNDALVIAQQDDTIRIAHRRAAVELACDCQILIGPCFRSYGRRSRYSASRSAAEASIGWLAEFGRQYPTRSRTSARAARFMTPAMPNARTGRRDLCGVRLTRPPRQSCDPGHISIPEEALW